MSQVRKWLNEHIICIILHEALCFANYWSRNFEISWYNKSTTHVFWKTSEVWVLKMVDQVNERKLTKGGNKLININPVLNMFWNIFSFNFQLYNLQRQGIIKMLFSHDATAHWESGPAIWLLASRSLDKYTDKGEWYSSHF